jgi:hypothetical protein
VAYHRVVHFLPTSKACESLRSILPLCQNDTDITRTASFINTPNDTEICALPQGLCYESLFIKKVCKYEELVSSGCLKKLLKNRVQQGNLRELYEFLQTTKTLSSP